MIVYATRGCLECLGISLYEALIDAQRGFATFESCEYELELVSITIQITIAVDFWCLLATLENLMDCLFLYSMLMRIMP